VGASPLDVRRALLDNSAWARLRPPSTVPAERRNEVAMAIGAGDVFVCLPFLLEARCSARDAIEHDGLLCELEALPHVEIDPAVERRTLDAQAQLARAGHHRLPPVDLMLAAATERHQLDILSTTPTTTWSPARPTSNSAASGSPGAVPCSAASGRPGVDSAPF
jgi:predicted nucleic acid-binding protein